MKELTEEERVIRQYLLRQLDDEERGRFEERVFTDRAYLDQVLMAEDELVEDFVFDELPAPDRESFVAHFLSTPQQEQKLQIAKALKARAARGAAEPKPPAAGVLAFLHRHKRIVKLTLAAALLLAVGVGAWLLAPDPLARELAQLNSPQAGLSVGAGAGDYPVTLTPGRVRGEPAGRPSEAAVVIPPDAQVVRLRLALMSDAYDGYRVAVHRDAGAAPLVVDNLKVEDGPDGKIVTVRIPARVLAPGYYQLTLGGYADGKLDDDIDSYTLLVVASS